MFESYASLAALRSILADAPEGVDFVAISNFMGQTTTVDFVVSDEENQTIKTVLTRTYDFEGAQIETPELLSV